MKRSKVDPSTVRDKFEYVPETGRLIRRKRGLGARVGREVGYIEMTGHRRISLGDVNWQASHLVWAWHYGEFPSCGLIHKNTVLSDDRIENLVLKSDLRRPVKIEPTASPEDQPETMLGDLPEEMNTGIYEIRNIKNGRKYVGSSVNVSKRWRQHLKALEDGVHHSRFMQRCWNKHGEDSFIFRLIYSCEKEDLIKNEQFYIDKIKPEYNTNKNASSMLGFKHSAETRKKMSASRDRSFSPMKGKTQSEAARAKISASKTGVKLGPYDRERVSRTARSVAKSKGVMDDDKVRLVRSLIASKTKYGDIAAQVGCSYHVVADIARNKTFQWVE